MFLGPHQIMDMIEKESLFGSTMAVLGPLAKETYSGWFLGGLNIPPVTLHANILLLSLN